MSNEVNYRQQWAEGEIEAGTLLDAIDTLEAECERLRGIIGLAAEFDAAPDDAEWEPPHPIFNMAQEIETLAAELAAIRAAGGELSDAVVGFQDPDSGFLNKHEHRGHTEPVVLLADAQRIVAAMAAERDVARTQTSICLKANEQLRAELEAARKQEPDSDADLATRMKAAGMMSVAELLAGAPLDAFTRHAAVKDLQSLLRWAEMRRAECLKAQARYDLGERDKSDDLYEWTVAHCAVFTELHVNIRAALAGLPPLAGKVAVPLSCDQILMAFEENGFRIEPGETFSAKGQIAQLLNAVGALLATPSMEVKHEA